MINIGDARKITQVKRVLRPSRNDIVDEWEFKGLYAWRNHADYRFVMCESTAWNLVGSAATDESKLQVYLWGNWTNMGGTLTYGARLQ